MRHSRQKLAAIAIVLLTVLFCGVNYIQPAHSQQGTYFSDFFNMNAYDWTAVSGVWAVVNGEYTEMVDPASDQAWSVAGSNSWFDYSVEAKVYSTDSNGTISLAGRWVDANNYYAMEYSDQGTPDSAKLVLYKKVNGSPVTLGTWTRNSNNKVPYIGKDAATVSDNPYPAVFKMKFLGAAIEVYVNGQLIGSTTDTSLYHGKIAVGENNRQAYFDDIYVWDITPPRLMDITETYNVGNAVTIEFNSEEYTSHWVYYGLTTSYGLSKITTTRETSHSVDLTGLTPGTIYHYKVTVKDAAGNATSSGDLTFTTDDTPDLTAPDITGVASSGITEDSAVVNWLTNEPGNTIIDYGLTSGQYKWSLSYDEKTTSHAVYLNRLNGKTKYYFKVKTRDIAGNLGVSDEYVLETLKNLKPKINAVTTGSTPSVNVAVYWTGIPAAERYKIYVSPDNNWNSVPDAEITETGAAEYVYRKDGLMANVNYYIKVHAEDAVGDSASTIVRAFPPDTNPHGGYTGNPDLCQNCHATHSAVGARLILETNVERLCITCHDGSQSKYDVLRGKYKGPDSLDHISDPEHTTWNNSIAGPFGSLEGFAVAEGVYVTSRHDLDIYNYAAPGNNIDNIEVADAHLSCASCHDPHGSENYRNLKENMRVSTSLAVPSILTEAYVVTEAAYETTTYVSGAVEFCGACHSDFNQGEGASRNAVSGTVQPGMNLSTSSLFKYMHPVNIDAQYVTDTGHAVDVPNLPLEKGKIICQTCHFTRGTLSTGTHVRRDGYSSTVLKRFNETTGCEDCHDKTGFPDE